MKYCPKCETRYDEDILRFCMKDGTPLLDGDEPKFIAMPSESLETPVEDDPSDVTVIRRNATPPPANVPSPLPDDFDDEPFTGERRSAPRIVIPTTPQDQPHRRPAAMPIPDRQPAQTNTFKVAFLTMIGTVFVLCAGALLFWFLMRDSGTAANTNVNVNALNTEINTNVNTNLGIDGNFNFNTNTGALNTNTNINANVNAQASPTRTPTPTPTRTPTPTPTPDDDDDDVPVRTPTPARTPNQAPTPIIIRPGSTPRPSDQQQQQQPQAQFSGGVLNSKALNMAKPVYPAAARQLGASGEVRVRVVVDQSGRVVSAKAVSGHPLLRSSAEQAARQSKFRTQATSGEVVYNFRNN